MKKIINLMGIVVVVVTILFMFSLNASASCVKKINGKWEGSLSIAGQNLSIFTDFKTDNMQLGTIDIPQQKAFALPLSNISQTDENVNFELNSGGTTIVFTGIIKRNVISGEIVQGTYKGSFHLSRVIKANNVGTAEKITLKTSNGQLFGTLQIPQKHKKRMPVVLIIAGSGPTDRDGNNPISGISNTYRKIAENLAQKGIASVRYDKRLIGESLTGESEDQITFDTFVNDAADWITKLKNDSRFSKVIVLGHSEGSLIGMASLNKVKADSFISVAGSGYPFDELILEQLKQQSPELYEKSLPIIKSLKEGKMVSDVPQELQMLFHSSVQPYLISEFKYNPAIEIGKLEMPILIIQGDNDIQVSVKNAELLAQAQPNAAYKIIKDMNHILKDAPTDYAGNVTTYADPSLPLTKEFVNKVCQFIRRN